MTLWDQSRPNDKDGASIDSLSGQQQKGKQANNTF